MLAHLSDEDDEGDEDDEYPTSPRVALEAILQIAGTSSAELMPQSVSTRCLRLEPTRSTMN